MQIVSGFNHGTGGDNEKPLIKAVNGLTMVMNKMNRSDGRAMYYGLGPDGGVVVDGGEAYVPVLAFRNNAPADDTPSFTIAVYGASGPIDLRTSHYHTVLVNSRDEIIGFIAISPAAHLGNEEVGFFMVDGDNLTMAAGAFFLPNGGFTFTEDEVTIENFSSTYVFSLVSLET